MPLFRTRVRFPPSPPTFALGSNFLFRAKDSVLRSLVRRRTFHLYPELRMASRLCITLTFLKAKNIRAKDILVILPILDYDCTTTMQERVLTLQNSVPGKLKSTLLSKNSKPLSISKSIWNQVPVTHLLTGISGISNTFQFCRKTAMCQICLIF